MTPSFNRLIEAVTDDELSKLNTLDLEDSLSLTKSFKPHKVMSIPSNFAATIGRPRKPVKSSPPALRRSLTPAPTTLMTTLAFSG